MWGRLKRKILRSKGGGGGGGVRGGGVYNSTSHNDDDDEFCNTRDTYRDFREELYDDSRGSGNSWKETGGSGGGGKPGKRMSLTKTPFPNLDRCSCGTPGGRDLQEKQVAKSETLRRKNDFILGVDSKSWGQTKGGVSVGKTRNDYTSTSTGPGTRGRAALKEGGGGGELRLRASTSTGQIPQQSEEQTRNVWNRHRRHNVVGGGVGRRLAYSDDEAIDDDDDDDDDSEEEVEDEEEDEEEEVEEEEEEARVPSTSQLSSFRNSSQSDGTKSSSTNSSDYTSLAFDLNYVKVSPPKLRLRRRKKNISTISTTEDKNSSAPLMVRRERRPFPEFVVTSGGSKPSDRLPPPSSRATESKRSVADSGSRDETITSTAVGGRVVILDGSDQGHAPRGTSKEGAVHSSPTHSKGDASCRQPVQAIFSPHKATKQEQQLSSGYVSWADIHNPSVGVINSTGGNTSEVSGSERVTVEERVKEETVAPAVLPGKRGSCGEISASGSVLQFTFTVRIDNDVFRGTRRDVERTNEAVASGSGSAGSGSGPAGSSMVSGRVDILNQEQKPGVTPTAGGVNNVLRKDHQGDHPQLQSTYNTGSDALSLVQRSFKVQLKDEGAKADAQNVAPSKEAGKVMFAESTNVTHDPNDGVRDPTTPCVPQKQVPLNVGGGYGITKTGSVVPGGVGGRQRTLEDFFVTSNNQGSRMTTVAIVHKSASDHGDEMNVTSLQSRNELGPTDGRDAYAKTGDLVPEVKSGGSPRKAFDEVHSCKTSKSHPPSSPPPVADDGAEELTHMSWDEVMREAESLGIPLSRPSQQPGGCSDRVRHPSTSTEHHQVLTSSSCSPPPTKHGASFQDVYFVCSSCTEAMQNQPSRKTQQQPSSKTTTSSPFKEKFKLQSIFGVSGGGGGGKKQPKGGGEERTTCKGQGTSSPINRKSQSPGTKYKTIPAGTAAATATTTKDIVLWGGNNCSCSTTRRSAQTSRQRSLSPVSSTRCTQAVHSSSPKAGGHWGRGGDRRGQRVSHLCSPPLLRCRFSSTGRTLVGGPAPSMTLVKSAHLSSEMLTSSSSPVKRRANDNDRDFLKSLAQLMGCSWYWGTLSFEAAEAELVDRPDGAFLVRDSSDDRYILSVSFRSQRSTHHVRIERHNGMFSFSAEHGLHESSDIVNFIENAVEWSQNGQCLYYLRPRQLNSAPVPVQLIYPVSRFAH